MSSHAKAVSVEVLQNKYIGTGRKCCVRSAVLSLFSTHPSISHVNQILSSCCFAPPLSLSLSLTPPRSLTCKDADATKHEWATNQHRDVLASHVGHFDHLSYLSVAQNQSIARVRHDLIDKMLQPCGRPPAKEGE